MLTAAWITARDLVGGLVLGVGLGSAADRLGEPLPPPIRRTLSALVALGILVVAGRLWNRDVARLAGVAEPSRRMQLITAVTFGAAFIIVGSSLAFLEPGMVERGRASGLGIHVVYMTLFVPSTFLVATLGALSLRMTIGERIMTPWFAVVTGICAATAFLVADLLMDAAGWRVGAPDAAKRATMLVVTFVSVTAAALAAGGALGWRMSSAQSV